MKSWVILVIGAFMFFAFMLNLPMLQEMIVVGDNLTAYTANTTYWVGWSELINFTPIVLIFLAITIPAVAWWVAHRSGE